MWRSSPLIASLLGLTLIGGLSCRTAPVSGRAVPMSRYLRVTVARWDIDLSSAEAERIFHQIDTDGVAPPRLLVQHAFSPSVIR